MNRETQVQSVQRHEEYARAKGLKEIFSLLVTDALSHPEESEDLIPRFMAIIKQQIADREGADPEKQLSIVREHLATATAECREKPWRPRSRGMSRPMTVPSKERPASGTQRNVKSEAVLKLEEERDRWRRKYYEQVARAQHLKDQEAQLMQQIAEMGGQLQQEQSEESVSLQE